MLRVYSMNKEYDWDLGPWAKSGKKLLTAKSMNVDTKGVKYVMIKTIIIITALNKLRNIFDSVWWLVTSRVKRA